MSETSEKLQKALELLGPNGENWIKGGMAGIYHNGRIRHCAATACGMEKLEAGRVLSVHIPKEYNGYVSWWNDAPNRTFAEVREVFLKAISANQ